MVQDFVNAAYRWVLAGAGLFRQFLPLIVFAILAGAAVWLAYRKIDPEGQTDFSKKLRKIGGRIGQTILLLAATSILCGTLVQARKTVDSRRGTIQQASASRRREPNLSGVVQFAPAVAVLENKTYTRTMTLPPDFASRLGAEGVQVLAPYLQDPTAENVSKLVDSFKRSGQDVVFTRELTRVDEVPVPADAADLSVQFRDEGAPSGRRHYDAEFTGEYRFANPRTATAPMRFAFDLPEGGGTVQEFYIQVANQRVMEPDERGNYVWKGDVAPGTQVVARVHYRVTGAAQYDYRLGSERRRIGNFRLVTISSQPPQFAKSGIYPSSISGSRAEWKLRDVLTAQAISLVFPRADLNSQILDKSMVMLPVALALFAAAAFWLLPKRALPGTVAFGVSLLLVPVLSGYASSPVATISGAVLAAAAGGLALGQAKGWIISILSATLTTVFLTIEHGGLAAWILAAVSVGLILARQPRSEAFQASETSS